jgi:hypothetical protein
MHQTSREKQVSRRALWLLGVGLLLAYAVLVPLKVAEMAPPYMTWLGVGLVPAIGFGLMAAEMTALTMLDRRSPRLMSVHAACIAVMIAVLAIVRGWR